MKNNAKNNGKQRKGQKLPGGVTGKGFQPGQSGNPTGRPRTRGLVNALKIAVSLELSNGQTVEEAIAAALIDEALNGKHRVPAINSIYDRIEGRPKQSIAIEDQTDREQLGAMTDDELIAALRSSTKAATANDGSDAPRSKPSSGIARHSTDNKPQRTDLERLRSGISRERHQN